jgi:hypothetical protein
MNKIILAMVFAFVFVLTGREACFAYNAHLAWNTVDDVRVAGYKVHYQMDSAVQPFSGPGATEIDLPGQSATPNTDISGLDPAHSYSFAVTSYITTVNNVKIESAYSNIVTVPVLTVFITAPDANSKVGGTVQVTATASAGTYAVDLFVNGNLQIPRLTPPYLFAWDTSTLDHGPYSLSAKAYYSPASSIAGESATVSVTVVKAKNQGTGDYYETLQQAYDDASEGGATLMLWSSERIVENIVCGLPRNVTIMGGYDQGFATNSGYTAFSGSFTIGRGTVVLDRVVIF